MITIQAIMLVSLGFLGAILLGLGIVPAYKRRLVRLTRNQIKQAMPLTEAEIRADKDRLRADYAIVIHELDAKLEKRTHDVARQRVEINRRDAAISGLEGEVTRMRTSLEEHENARRVLEHTIMDRLPKVEQRLAEARKLLTQRDREIAKLSTSAGKQSNALDEATQINAQNRDEIHRLNAALTTRAARSREGMGDQRFDGEVALRSEIEALRAKTRDQATLISRLQGMLERASGALGAGAAAANASNGLSNTAKDMNGIGGANGSGEDQAPISSPLGIYRAEDEIARLRNDLGEAEATLRSVKNTSQENDASRNELEQELRVVKAFNEDQSAEIAKLKAALGAYQSLEKDERAIPGRKVAMQARISELTALSDERAATISRLRAEVAAGNEKLARQASHFMNEMRRLGAGSMPMAMPNTGRQQGNPANADAQMAAQAAARSGGARPEQQTRLSDRIVDPRQREPQVANAGASSSVTIAAATAPTSGASAAPPDTKEALAAAAPSRTDTTASAANNTAAPATINFSKTSSPTSAPTAEANNSDPIAKPTTKSETSKKPASPKSTSPQPKSQFATGKKAKPEPARRGGLIDRITRMDGTK